MTKFHKSVEFLNVFFTNAPFWLICKQWQVYIFLKVLFHRAVTLDNPHWTNISVKTYYANLCCYAEFMVISVKILHSTKMPSSLQNLNLKTFSMDVDMASITCGGVIVLPLLHSDPCSILMCQFH